MTKIRLWVTKIGLYIWLYKIIYDFLMSTCLHIHTHPIIAHYPISISKISYTLEKFILPVGVS